VAKGERVKVGKLATADAGLQQAETAGHSEWDAELSDNDRERAARPKIWRASVESGAGERGREDRRTWMTSRLHHLGMGRDVQAECAERVGRTVLLPLRTGTDAEGKGADEEIMREDGA
jgi:hypothetical protein